MTPKLITSKENPAYKALLKLAASGWESQEILVEGEKLIAEALRAGLVPRSAWTDGEPSNAATCPWFRIPSRLYRRVSPTKSGRAPLCVFPLPALASASAQRLAKGRFLLLDRIQEPGNAGALIRAAAAFGMDAVLWIKPSVFPFHHGCIRASAGSVFHLQQMRCDLESLVASETALVGADREGAVALDRFQWPRNFILVLGHEGGGIAESLRARLHARIWVPTTDRVESLNVSGAAHVLMYSFFLQNPPGSTEM